MGIPTAIVNVEHGSNIDATFFKSDIHVPDLKSYRFFRIYNPKSNRWSQLFTCDYEEGGVCGKQFKKWHNLFDHLRIHCKEKPFICPILGCTHKYS
jgi:hypothetical protein